MSNLKFPSASVAVPLLDHFATTDTPPIGDFVSASVTFPLTVRCAEASMVNEQSKTVMLSSFASFGNRNL